MKWIGSKIEQFVTKFYSDLHAIDIHGSVIEAPILSVSTTGEAYDSYSLLIYKTGSGSNVINFYNQGLVSGDHSINFVQQVTYAAWGGASTLYQAHNILNIHAKGITVDSGFSYGATPTVLITNLQKSESAANSVGLHVDFDRTVPTTGTAAHNDTGINLDVTSDSLGSGSTTVGMDIDVVGGRSGASQVATGIHLDVDGADTNIGMVINTAGTHLKLEANADVNDYATFTLADTGDLTIATVGSASIDSDLTLDADGQIKLEPAAGKNILLDGTIAVDAGVVTGATSITSGAFVGTSFTGASPNIYGSTIKILPSDFMTNDDGGSTKFGIGFHETDEAGFGMKVPNALTELLAFVSIPEGMKATHVDVFDEDNRAVAVFEANLNSRTITALETGNCNTTLNITDVNATATNYLLILVTTTATGDRTFGGLVTIAAQ